MRRIFWLAVLATVVSSAQAPRKRHVLFIGQSLGWTHDSISHAMVTLDKLGAQSGLFDVTLRTDVQLITKKPLKDNAKNLDYGHREEVWDTPDIQTMWLEAIRWAMGD